MNATKSASPTRSTAALKSFGSFWMASSVIIPPRLWPKIAIRAGSTNGCCAK